MSVVEPGPESPSRQRWDFVTAFVEHSWTRPGTGRGAVRPHILLTLATVAAVVALGAGVILQLIAPIELAPAVPPPPPSAGGPAFVAVTGWDCPATATSGFEATGRQPAWRTVANGGWAQDGCHGTFQVMPYSGATPSAASPQGSATWWFVPKEAVRCTLAVYVPDEQPATYRPAGPVQFSVLAGRRGQRFAQFEVDQSGHRGSWEQVGTYTATANGIAVLMVSEGQPSAPDAMMAITQVKAECR